MLSRRALIGSGVALTALRPALAKAPRYLGPPVRQPARLSSNENPYGACPAAIAAIKEAIGRAWRYPDEAVDELRAEIAKLHSVQPEWILVGDGSAEILKVATSAYTGPGRRLLTADPTFESCEKHAEASRDRAYRLLDRLLDHIGVETAR